MNEQELFQKELKELLKNKEILVTIIIMPIIFALLVPASMITLNFADTSDIDDTDVGFDIFRNMAPYWDELDNLQKVTVIQSNFYLAFLIMIPMVVPMAISSDSIAGEKERKTIERLLAAPITNQELFIGKALAAAFPTIVISLVAEIVYIIFTDIILYDLMNQRIILPNIFSAVMFVLIIPAQTILTTLIMTAISSRSKGSREALQKSGIIAMPYIFLIATIVFLPMLVHPLLSIASGAIIIGICLLIFRVATNSFKRDKLLSVGS